MKNIIPQENLVVGALSFERAWSAVEIDGKQYDVQWQGSCGSYSASVPGAALFCKTEKTAGGIRLSASVKLEKAVDSFKLHLICLPAVELDHYAGCGAKMGRAQIISFPAEAAIEGYHNCVFTRNGKQTVFSTPLKQSYDSGFTGKVSGKLLLDFKYTIELAYNDLTDMVFDPVTVETGDAVALLQQYAENNKETERDFSGKPQYGWNSWDYYRWTITEDEVIRNAEFIAGDPVLCQNVKRIIVDDGWQYCYGEWEANCLFPSGMKSLAERLKKMNFVPGLWLAPSIIEPHCRIAQWDQDMLALSKSGQPCLAYSCMKRFGFVLDPTVEKTRRHLKALFDRYAGMGYQYFKLDFLASTMLADRFHDASVPRSRIMRMLLDPILEGVDKRAEILGCNYHFYNGNSYVNSVRVGADIHAKWESVKKNTAFVAYMFWSNKKLWLNDPDFALCRGPETSDDPDLNRLRPSSVFILPGSDYNPAGDFTLGVMGYEEAKVLLSIVLMGAGAVNLSDKLYRLNEKGLELARKVVSAESGETAIPLDLFESSLPVYWLQKISTGYRLLVVNWQDSAAVIPVDWQRVGRKPSQVREFWSGSVSAAPDAAELPPHSCLLWEF